MQISFWKKKIKNTLIRERKQKNCINKRMDFCDKGINKMRKNEVKIKKWMRDRVVLHAVHPERTWIHVRRECKSVLQRNGANHSARTAMHVIMNAGRTFCFNSVERKYRPFWIFNFQRSSKSLPTPPWSLARMHGAHKTLCRSKHTHLHNTYVSSLNHLTHTLIKTIARDKPIVMIYNSRS